MIELSQKRKKIAILEDDPQISDFLQEVLLKSGYEALTASDTQRGLSLINRERPDLIILDLVMQGLSGLALLDILNAKGNTIPVLVISDTSSIVDNLAHQGIAGLLLKPIDVNRLLTHIDTIFKLGASVQRRATGADEITQEDAPAFEAAAPPPEAVGKQSSPSAAQMLADGGQRSLILVVEDEPDMQTLLRQLLEFHGAEVVTAADGAEAIEQAQRRRPQLILLDIMLPRLDGFQVCRLLKFNDKFRGIPVIMLTARSLASDRDLAKAAGASAYVTKPFDPKDLLAKIKRAMSAARGA